MKQFYAGLGQDGKKLAALHDAQVKTIADRRTTKKAAHPFFWAGFILVGDPE
jgi:CHAT domain-containing protein